MALIEKEALKATFKRVKWLSDADGLAAVQLVSTAPTIDAALVVHGRWILNMVGIYKDIREYSCSKCSYSLPLNPQKIPRYCEDCGAQMGEEDRRAAD